MEIMGLESENQKGLKSKPNTFSNQKLVSGSVGKGDENKTVLAVWQWVTKLQTYLSKMAASWQA